MNAWKFCSHRRIKKGVTLTLKENASPMFAKVDRRLFIQLILKILSNAVKFSLENGKVEIFLVGGHENGIVIQVTDHGIRYP